MASNHMEGYTTQLVIRKGEINHRKKDIARESPCILSENGNSFNHFKNNLALPNEVGNIRCL